MSDDQDILFHLPPRGAVVPAAPPAPARALVSVTIDGQPVDVAEGATLLDACRAAGKDIPTLCYLETLTPVNACRVCVVEVEGARVLAPACSRKVEAGHEGPDQLAARAHVAQGRAGAAGLVGGSLDRRRARARCSRNTAPIRRASAPRRATVAQPLKDDNDLYVRDYSKCVLCYKCVEACGTDAQNTFAIAVAGRGFHAHISTELDVPLPESACVYCGNCIAVCPDRRAHGQARVRTAAGRAPGCPKRQAMTDTICPYCGVGCTLTTHVQDDRIVKITSPFDNDVTAGNLCVKGRFGFEYVNEQGTGNREQGAGSSKPGTGTGKR